MFVGADQHLGSYSQEERFHYSGFTTTHMRMAQCIIDFIKQYPKKRLPDGVWHPALFGQHWQGDMAGTVVSWCSVSDLV
jgi:hypothetical protein